MPLTNTEQPSFIMVYASAIGAGTALVQAEEKGERQDISYTSHFLTESGQKFALTYGKLTAIVYALEIIII